MIELMSALLFVAVYVMIFGSRASYLNTPFSLPIQWLVDVTWGDDDVEPRAWLAFVLGTFLVWLVIIGVEICW